MAEGNKPSTSRRREYDLFARSGEGDPLRRKLPSGGGETREKAPEKSRKPASPASPALWILRPDDSDDETAEPAKIPKTHQTKSAPDATALAGEVRRAMKLLQSGKAVAAYQTLEKAPAGRRGVMPRAVPACLSGQPGQ